MNLCSEYRWYDRFFLSHYNIFHYSCFLEPKFCQTFGLVIFNFLPDRQRFLPVRFHNPTVFGKDCRNQLTLPKNHWPRTNGQVVNQIPSIPGRDIPKLFGMVLAATRLALRPTG